MIFFLYKTYELTKFIITKWIQIYFHQTSKIKKNCSLLVYSHILTLKVCR